MKKYHVEFQFVSADGRLTDQDGNENYICVRWLTRRQVEFIKRLPWIKILTVKEIAK